MVPTFQMLTLSLMFFVTTTITLASSGGRGHATLNPASSSYFSSFGNGGTNGGTNGGDLGCTRTQGYWGSSPAGEQRLVQLVGMNGMLLGDVNYSASQLNDIFDTPTGGNALLSLAHQLMAAKLNVLNGASDSVIADDIDQADLLIGSLIVPPVGSASVSNSSTLGQQMDAVKNSLDDYNNGKLNVPKCD